MEFSKVFLQKEVREGFEIPEMMKRACAAQMEVLAVVADVCDRNGIQQFANGGTLLGAVRHKGFIPWDDDIDICLRRKEYNRLIRILPDQLPYGFTMIGTYSEDKELRKDVIVPQLCIVANDELWDFNDYVKYFHIGELEQAFSSWTIFRGKMMWLIFKNHSKTGNYIIKRLG